MAALLSLTGAGAATSRVESMTEGAQSSAGSQSAEPSATESAKAAKKRRRREPPPDPTPLYGLVDAHTHLAACGGRSAETVRAIVDHAESVGVEMVVTVADDMVDARWAVSAADWDDRVYAAVALHPMHARLKLEAAEHAPARDTGARLLRAAHEARPGHGVAERLSARIGVL